MTVTRSAHGRYISFITDASSDSDITSELSKALSDDGMAAERVVVFDVTKKVTVAEVGR